MYASFPTLLNRRAEAGVRTGALFVKAVELEAIGGRRSCGACTWDALDCVKSMSEDSICAIHRLVAKQNTRRVGKLVATYRPSRTSLAGKGNKKLNGILASTMKSTGEYKHHLKTNEVDAD